MKVSVVFTVDVTSCTETELPSLKAITDVTQRKIKKAVEEAVTACLQRGQADGHSHAMENEISILMDSEVRAELLD